MALLHRSEISPSKTEVITSWVESRSWFAGDAGAPLDKVAAFRFDDPDGRVGIETLLVRAGSGPVHQIPLTYRDAPLPGAEEALLGTMEHSVLGTRYVYDGLRDPASLAALATATLGGGVQADEFYELDGVRAYRDPSATVAGSGTAGSAVDAPAVSAIRSRDTGSVSVTSFDGVVVAVARVPGIAASELATALGEATADAPDVLSGTWDGHADPITLAVARASRPRQ
jgi:hypothetical protein